MKPKQILAIGIALSLLLSGTMVLGAAAADTSDHMNAHEATAFDAAEEPPANETDDAPENASDVYVGDSPDNTTQIDFLIDGDGVGNVEEPPGQSDENADAANGSADAADEHAADTEVGPDDGLPDQAADHVSQVHEVIESFLGGSFDHLGESLSDLLSTSDDVDDTNDAAET